MADFQTNTLSFPSQPLLDPVDIVRETLLCRSATAPSSTTTVTPTTGKFFRTAGKFSGAASTEGGDWMCSRAIGTDRLRNGDRVLVGAITPCGQCNPCLSGNWSQCGGALGGWKFGNTIHGAQAQYLRVPHAQANLAKIPDELTDEQVVLLADIASTGISAAERAEMRIGDSVAIFAQGPIGLCATAGAKLKGASLIIAVESDPVRAEMALT